MRHIPGFISLFLLLNCGGGDNPKPEESIWIGNSERYELEITCRVIPIGYSINQLDMDVQWIQGTIIIPKTIYGRQRLIDFKYHFEPDRFKNLTKFEFGEGEDYGNSYLIYRTNYPEDTFSIVIQVTLDLYGFDFNTAKKINDPIDPKYLPEFTELTIKDSLMQVIADSIGGQTDMDVVKNIFEYVKTHVKYVSQEQVYKGAHDAVLTREGDCSEFTSLFVNLCRTKGIPTRKVSGIVADTGTYTISNLPGHAWAVVYLQEYGWVPFDPTWRVFDKTEPVYIYLIDNLKYALTEFSDMSFTKNAYYGFKIKPTWKITKMNSVNDNEQILKELRLKYPIIEHLQ